MPDQPDGIDADCLDLIDQLGALGPEDYRFLPAGTVRAYVGWLVARCRENADIAAAFIQASLEHFEKFPSLAELRHFWDSLHPKAGPPVATLDCPHCRGTGYEVIERAGISGARPCRTGHVASVDEGKPPVNQAEEDQKRKARSGEKLLADLAGGKL